ncbi:DUF4258 domain-containing protein [Bradyrhizobium sp.]|uniref:DUF4258 domain-containing protein n=1 Tax=Bradyrhizobium sp. TaxID=376 RepID=UPI0039C8B1F8
MTKKPIGLTAHARVRLRDRGIDPKWIRETILEPDWTEVDPGDPAIDEDFVPFQSLADAFFAWPIARQIRTFAL